MPRDTLTLRMVSDDEITLEDYAVTLQRFREFIRALSQELAPQRRPQAPFSGFKGECREAGPQPRLVASAPAVGRHGRDGRHEKGIPALRRPHSRKPLHERAERDTGLGLGQEPDSGRPEQVG